MPGIPTLSNSSPRASSRRNNSCGQHAFPLTALRFNKRTTVLSASAQSSGPASAVDRKPSYANHHYVPHITHNHTRQLWSSVLPLLMLPIKASTSKHSIFDVSYPHYITMGTLTRFIIKCRSLPLCTSTSYTTTTHFFPRSLKRIPVSTLSTHPSQLAKYPSGGTPCPDRNLSLELPHVYATMTWKICSLLKFYAPHSNYPFLGSQLKVWWPLLLPYATMVNRKKLVQYQTSPPKRVSATITLETSHDPMMYQL